MSDKIKLYYVKYRNLHVIEVSTICNFYYFYLKSSYRRLGVFVRNLVSDFGVQN